MTPVLYRDDGITFVNWILLCRRVKIVGLILGAAATGSWITSIRLQESTLPYKEQATYQMEHLTAKVGANPAQVVDCLTKRGDKAERVAEAAVASATDIRAPIPDLGTIPDCPASKK